MLKLNLKTVWISRVTWEYMVQLVYEEYNVGMFDVSIMSEKDGWNSGWEMDFCDRKQSHRFGLLFDHNKNWPCPNFNNKQTMAYGNILPSYPLWLSLGLVHVFNIFDSLLIYSECVKEKVTAKFHTCSRVNWRKVEHKFNSQKVV